MTSERAADRAERFFLESTDGLKIDNSRATGATLFEESDVAQSISGARSAKDVGINHAMESRGRTKVGAQSGGRDAVFELPDALREAGRRAAALAQNPVARSLLAAGLVTAAAALAANKNLRQTAKKSTRQAQDAAEAAADAAAESANKIGAAMINAATEAVRRMMGEGAGKKAAAAKPAPPAKAAAKPAKKAARSRRLSRPTHKLSTGKGKTGSPGASKGL